MATLAATPAFAMALEVIPTLLVVANATTPSMALLEEPYISIPALDAAVPEAAVSRSVFALAAGGPRAFTFSFQPTLWSIELGIFWPNWSMRISY